MIIRRKQTKMQQTLSQSMRVIGVMNGRLLKKHTQNRNMMVLMTVKQVKMLISYGYRMFIKKLPNITEVKNIQSYKKHPGRMSKSHAPRMFRKYI